MWRYDGYKECKNVYRKQIKKTSIFICLIFLCHKLIIKMHCIGTWLKEWITLCLQIKISRRICNRLKPLRYQNLSLFKHFWNLEYLTIGQKAIVFPFVKQDAFFSGTRRYYYKHAAVHNFIDLFWNILDWTSRDNWTEYTSITTLWPISSKTLRHNK